MLRLFKFNGFLNCLISEMNRDVILAEEALNAAIPSTAGTVSSVVHSVLISLFNALYAAFRYNHRQSDLLKEDSRQTQPLSCQNAVIGHIPPCDSRNGGM